MLQQLGDSGVRARRGLRNGRRLLGLLLLLPAGMRRLVGFSEVPYMT